MDVHLDSGVRREVVLDHVLHDLAPLGTTTYPNIKDGLLAVLGVAATEACVVTRER